MRGAQLPQGTVKDASPQRLKGRLQECLTARRKSKIWLEVLLLRKRQNFRRNRRNMVTCDPQIANTPITPMGGQVLHIAVAALVLQFRLVAVFNWVTEFRLAVVLHGTQMLRIRSQSPAVLQVPFQVLTIAKAMKRAVKRKLRHTVTKDRKIFGKRRNGKRRTKMRKV
ncbi:hypothetical protein TRVL_05695 [Trypanosoma vivax]|nr:hypothetical protein TRVL_05695 [Trypanosoma vivax]